MRILIVDDDEVSRVVIQRKLEQLGYEAAVATSGDAAWAMVQAESFDVIISDWVMPGLDGLALCRAVRALFERSLDHPYTYFVVLTALASRESRTEAIRTGVDEYLVKPVDAHELRLRMIVAERISALHRRLGEQAAESRRLNQELHAAVRRDPLTGVGNRHLLAEATDALCASLAKRPRPVAVMLVDVDHFKAYNDIYLHLQGDVALRGVAEVLDRVARDASADQDRGAFRFGGEEFVAIVDDVTGRSAARVAETLRSEVQRLAIPHAGNPPFGVVTISVGVAILDLGAIPLTQLSIRRGIREADRALFHAKDSGRNQVVIVTSNEAITV